ncbi:MAG TPA: hypothetical protein VFF31_07350 [Blastocatellia bacterium]|nr:hypothetical protein [Blastocatellia bacterium]
MKLKISTSDRDGINRRRIAISIDQQQGLARSIEYTQEVAVNVGPGLGN